MDLSLKSLQVPLPEDIEKLKGHGDFALAQRIIDQRLTQGLPTMLKERLLLEKEILSRIPQEYPYGEKEALALLEEVFSDVTPEDLTRLREEDAADWYYIDGELRFKSDFIANITKTRPAWAARVKNPKDLEDREGNFSLLDATIDAMQQKGKLAYHIHAAMSLRVKPEYYERKKLRVHLPLPIEYAQVKNLKILKISPEPTLISPPQHGSRTVFFEGVYEEDQEFTVEFSFENHVAYTSVDPEALSQLQPRFYTEEQEPHIVFTPYIRSLCEEIIGEETNPLLKARRIYDFVTTKVIYSFVRPYLTMTQIPHYCLTSMKGDCGVLALSFITLCRCAGIPARWQSGLYANPLSIGNHDWAQYYVEPYGWLFADCSFGGAAYRAGNEKRWNFYACHLEPFRIPFASEFQHPLMPEKRFLRHDPYDNQNGEAEYEDHGLISEHLITRSTLLAIRELEVL